MAWRAALEARLESSEQIDRLHALRAPRRRRRRASRILSTAHLTCISNRSNLLFRCCPRAWRGIGFADTSLDAPDDIAEPGEELPVGTKKLITIGDRATVIFVGQIRARRVVYLPKALRRRRTFAPVSGAGKNLGNKNPLALTQGMRLHIRPFSNQRMANNTQKSPKAKVFGTWPRRQGRSESGKDKDCDEKELRREKAGSTGREEARSPRNLLKATLHLHHPQTHGGALAL